MKIQCACGSWHELSPTALVLVVRAFIDGDLQTVSPGLIAPICIKEAFTKARVADIQDKYKGNSIRIQT